MDMDLQAMFGTQLKGVNITQPLATIRHELHDKVGLPKDTPVDFYFSRGTHMVALHFPTIKDEKTKKAAFKAITDKIGDVLGWKFNDSQPVNGDELLIRISLSGFRDKLKGTLPPSPSLGQAR